MADPMTKPLTSEHDDIDVLRAHLQMPDLPYVDFSLRNEHAQALAHWPLLAELAREPQR